MSSAVVTKRCHDQRRQCADSGHTVGSNDTRTYTSMERRAYIIILSSLKRDEFQYIEHDVSVDT